MDDGIGAILPVITLVIGYALKIAQDWWSARRARQQEEREFWARDRQQYYLPLLGAARELNDRLTRLTLVYSFEPDHFSPDSLSADFRELLMLSADPIRDLYGADPNAGRANAHAVQRLRTRMCRELNFATSSLYRTARYLALAESTRSHLAGGRHGLPEPAASELADRIVTVASALEGPGGAGLPKEQQESIGQIMSTDENRVITQYEFRKRLLDLPGWEQFTALMTFFITEDDDLIGRPDAARLQAKIDHEIRETVRGLNDLCANLAYLTALDRPAEYQFAPRNLGDPW